MPSRFHLAFDELTLDLIEQKRQQLTELCQAHRVAQLELFGSAATGRFDAGRSDLDFLVEFGPDERLGLKGDYFSLLMGLEDLFNRKIDLVETRAITNPYFRASAMAHRIPLYERAAEEALGDTGEGG